MEQFALVKRYRGRQQIIAKGPAGYCSRQMEVARDKARPIHTKNYAIAFHYLPVRLARHTKF